MAKKREERELVKGREVCGEEAEGKGVRRVGRLTEEVMRGGFVRGFGYIRVALVRN
jgi:hypothetical protein